MALSVLLYQEMRGGDQEGMKRKEHVMSRAGLSTHGEYVVMCNTG